MRVTRQMAMVFNLDKCLGCNTCTIACKNVWTNREGAEYMFWNNVETKPGVGYPREWENQAKYRGGWSRRPGRASPRLDVASRFRMMVNLFYNPVLPRMEEYYGRGPFTFTYEDLHAKEPTRRSQPVARPRSMITGEEEIPLEYGVNWEDNAAGTTEEGTGGPDYNFSDMTEEERRALLAYRDAFMLYLPRICNHCLNPACVAACPSGAAYKREEDGVVLIDQDRCRAWRYCVSGCPYKKPYYNWRTGKMEKCLLCYPRLETGQAPACFHACPGRIRYLGPLLYDLDRVAGAANVPEAELVEAQRSIVLDPHDPEVAAAAREAGIGEAWLEACRRSPVYRMFVEWEIALPLHPEFRTLPCLFYVPPQSPVRTAANGRSTGAGSGAGPAVEGGARGGHGTATMVGGETVLPSLDDFRIPLRYLARLLAAGEEAPVRKALARLLAVRAHRRAERVEGSAVPGTLEAVGLTPEDARAMHRLLALAHYHERFVIPTAHREETDASPYIERGFTGFDELGPSDRPRRRTGFHGGSLEVGS